MSMLKQLQAGRELLLTMLQIIPMRLLQRQSLLDQFWFGVLDASTSQYSV